MTQTDTIAGFLDALAAKVPAPGGGATAALHLGQAAALVSMVARYTVGPRYAEHEDLVKTVCERADAARTRALRLVDEDMAAFRSVIDAYRLPKSTEPEQKARFLAISAAAQRAAAVPADVARTAAEVLGLAEQLLPVANSNVISDVAAAADAARAAATTARVNVEINLSSITDHSIRASLAQEMNQVDELLVRADTITAHVRKLLTS
ncbi:cyclodeaminase/cyclohydrolase family protein [Mycolicibacterium wolinskyi]|uniref:Formimidoyltetrahydrofolate cyclodeaminase n=1 Tax=Mycolicibacterium wolinskyi TaxID=59750 RepID=A0A1X2F890_9MYCO|nr:MULTISPECIES: cyclodeaminase/cyclohydrolase family protein [Mycolicibacterium]MCV7286662.1 cyclodeaminase/cyclohydrolase family protein [Mycolicibacterium wolinskyi]MCV7293642.1 cyclodeaminase/cyclohydrolase family protein [Mycolicibacterium goodii]ORX14635.1 formimidoyltetrahydrofolate cyclodeaminase [Mycolicibacterium wolinskyi]